MGAARPETSCPIPPGLISLLSKMGITMTYSWITEQINKVINVEHLAWCLAVKVLKKMRMSINNLCSSRKAPPPWTSVSSSLEGGARSRERTSRVLPEQKTRVIPLWRPSPCPVSSVMKPGSLNPGHGAQATAWALTAASIVQSNRTMWQKNPWEKKIQSRPIWRKDFVKIILKSKRDFLFFFCLRSSSEKGYQAELSLRRLLQDHMSLQKCHFNWCKCEGVRTPGIKFLLKYTCFLGGKNELLTQGMQSLLENSSKPDMEGIRCRWPFRAPPPCCRLAWDHTWPCWPRGRGWGEGHLS